MTDNDEPVLLDTSVWIDALRGKTPEIVSWTQALLNDDRVLTCGPVLFEIKRGMRAEERKKLLPLFDALLRLSFNDAVWDLAGELDASLRSRGIAIPPMDGAPRYACITTFIYLRWMSTFSRFPG